MKLRILGCSGADFSGCKTSSYLIDRSLLVDAGTITSVLSVEEQSEIRQVLITHSHLDHIKGLPSLADSRCFDQASGGITVAGISETVSALREHLFNGILWPDFSRLPTREKPAISFMSVEAEVEYEFGDYVVTPFRVNHTVPAVGFLVRSRGVALLFSGDTGPTDRLWEFAPMANALIVEVSFPNDMEQLARDSCHLTSRMLATELGKARHLPPRILVTHSKPQFHTIIQDELRAVGVVGIELLSDGDLFEF